MRGAKITFVLGAGASATYGFPVASQMRDDICDELGNRKRLYADFKKLFSMDDRAIDSFRDQFYYSNIYSIDVFLSEHPEYMDIGKAAIILRLNRNEHKAVLGQVADNWFPYIIGNFIDFNHNIRTFQETKVRFISFNYDRSLEELLYCNIRHGYFGGSLTDKQKQDVASLVKSIRVVHIYGRFDDLDWEQEGGRAYGDQDSLIEHYPKIVGQIELMRKEEIDSQLAQRCQDAQEFISDSDFLVFLGFGFDQQNFSLLNINNLFGGQNIYASLYGSFPAQQRSVYNMFAARIRDKLVLGNSEHNCEEFMKDKIVYI